MKKVTDNLITGTIGEDKTGVVVQEKMGYLWRPQTRYDVGYDGEIEIRNGTTKEVIGLIVKVQSKALQDFESDKSDSFVYTCVQKDFDYWMNTNVPDIIVLSKPMTNEIYWSPIKKYFEDNPKNKKDRKILFNKKTNKFDEEAKQPIAQLAVPKNSGLYLPPIQVSETIYSNLITVNSYPSKLYVAITNVRDSQEIISSLRAKGEYGIRQWILHNKAIYSFSPLDIPAWDGLYEDGTYEQYDSSEWGESNEEDKQWVFSLLLNKSFGVKCYQSGLKFDSELQHYYFDVESKEIEREIKYKSISKKTARFAIKAYYSKKDPGKLNYYKHLAFSARFLKYDGDWYLQINPTYHFTYDGKNRYQYYDQPLKGIKRLQRNKNVLGDLISITEFLKQTFGESVDYEEVVSIGENLNFDVIGGIDDNSWIGKESSQ